MSVLTYTFKKGDTRTMHNVKVKLAGFSTEEAYAILYVNDIRYEVYTDTWQLAGDLKVYVFELDDPSETAKISAEPIEESPPPEPETGTIWEVRIELYKLPWFTPMTNAQIASVVTAVSSVVSPLGYQLKGQELVWKADKTGLLRVYYKETGTPAIAIPPIVVAIGLLLLGMALVVVSVSIYKWVGTNSALVDSQAGVYEDAAALLKKKYESGEITYEQYIQGLKDLQALLPKPTDWGTILLVGVGILALAYVLGGKK